MHPIPRDLWPDATLPVAVDPYRFIARRARRLGTDAFRSRLLGRPAVFLTGPEAAAFFYAPGRFRRAGAVPELVAGVLFGEGGVQRLDGEEHRRRKALWLSLMTDAALDELDRIVERTWEDALPELVALSSLDVFPQAARILTTSVCRWAGVPLQHGQIGETCTMLSSLFLHAASLGPEHLEGRRNRKRATAWARGLIRSARHSGDPPAADVTGQVSAWRDASGEPLSEEIAATELLNVLRPVVAVAVYVTYLAMALHRHPGCRDGVAHDAACRTAFVQEVRRLYPFFPAVAALAAADTEWQGGAITAGTRAVLDLHGTCRDRRVWEDADAFRPERFTGREHDPWALIPQGGGDHAVTHRCPGEWITIRLMCIFARRLALARYDVATPETRPAWRRAPALPKGGFQLLRFRPGERITSSDGPARSTRRPVR
jgi:fatty-acid peroxygenase